MRADVLDRIIKNSLRSCYEEIKSEDWYGREREMVSTFVLRHLAQHCEKNAPLCLAQIGIEVAVHQLGADKKHPGRNEKRPVCKDIVIWPEVDMVCWGKDRSVCNEPLAVMEWKVNHYFNRRDHKKNRNSGYQGDIEWLRDTSVRLRKKGLSFTGYAVLVEAASKPRTLRCVRICDGTTKPNFLQLPD